MKTQTKLGLCAFFAGAFGWVQTASAITFTGNDGSGRTASASFTQSGTELTVTLANTATGDLANGGNNRLLSAVFFTLTGNPTLTPVSAFLEGSSTIIRGAGTTIPADGNVGGEFAYGARQGTWPAAPAGQNIITAVGFGLAGIGNGNFGGADLNSQAAVDGGNYALTTTTDDPTTPPGGGLFSPLIQSSVVFKLTLPAGYILSSVSQVGFQYGTALGDTTEPNVPGETPGVPDGGATLALLGFGLVGMGWFSRRGKIS